MRKPTPILLALVAGCYSYQPIETPAPALRTRVQADLTDAGSVQMASQIGPGISSVRGEVIESDSQAVLLALTSVVGRNEQEVFWAGEQVRIPLTSVARLQQRRFAASKTMVFGGAFLGSLLLAVEAFTGPGSGGGGGGSGGGSGNQ
jgi:hypothetical protein